MKLPTSCCRGVLCLLLLPTAVVAATRVATVVTTHEPAEAPRALASWYKLEEILRESPRFSLVPLGLAHRQDTERGKRVERGSARLQKALAAYEELDLMLARGWLDKAIPLLEEGGAEEGRDALLKALALRALILQIQGRVEEAQGDLQWLFTLAPGYGFDPEDLSPQFAELEARVRSQVAETPKVSWRVHSGEVHGLVFVDGVWRGVTPLLIEDVTPGRHYLTVLAPGFHPTSISVEVGAAQDSAVELEEAPGGAELRTQLRVLEQAGQERTAMQAAAAALARRLEAERVLLARLSQGAQALEVTAWVVAADGRAVSGSRTFDQQAKPDEIAAFVASLLDQELPERELRKEEPPVPTVRSGLAELGTRRTLALVGLGVSAAAGVTGLLLGQSTLAQAGQAHQIPVGEEQSFRAAQSRLQQTALGANGLYLVSLAAAGAATWLFLTPGQEPLNTWSISVTPLPGGAGAVVGRSFK